MAIIINKRVNLDAPIKLDSLCGFTFTTESEAHRFVVRCDQNGQELTLTGTISAKFVRADGNTVELVGTIEDGKAVVTLAQDCYNVYGRFQLAIFNTVGNTKLCIYACIGTVQRAQSGNLIDGGGIIPDVEDLIADIQTAVESIPPSYTTLLASIAGTYSASKTYSVGEYAWYNGTLYRCSTAISTAEAWTSVHWTAAVLGDDVSSLKSALKEKAPIGTVGFNVWDEEYIVKSGNHIETKNYIPVEPETDYYLETPTRPAYGLRFYDENYNRISTRYNAGLFTTPANCRYIKFGIDDPYGVVYNNDICLNISQPDTSIEPHNGQYVPGNYLKNYSDLLDLKIAVNGNLSRIENAEANADKQQVSIIALADKVGVFETEPVLKNGSNGNKWNNDFVCTSWNADATTITQSVSPGDVISLLVSRPLSAQTNRYINGYIVYNSLKEEIDSRAVLTPTSTQWYENIEMPQNAAYVGFTLAECSQNNEYVPLRTTDFAPGQVKIRQTIHDGLEKRVLTLEEELGSDLPRIVKQNEDVAPAVDACGRYGLHSGGVMNNSRNFCMLVTTDVHQATENMKSAIDYLNEKEAIQCGCCLGDMAAGNYAQTDGTWFTNLVNASDKPFYTIIGNHDGGNSKDASISATVAQSFAKWIEPTLSKIGLPSLNVPYYVINTDYNVTLIMLNNYDVPDTMDGTNFAVSRGDEVLSQAQVNWLLSTLDNIPATNHLLVLMHAYPYANVAVESNFSQYGYRPGGSSYPAYTEIIPDIINAWMTGTAIQKTYTPQIDSDYLGNIIIDHDFSSRGNGIFVGYLVGHTHKDIIAKSSVYKNQKIYCLTDTAGGTWQNEGSDLPRVDGTKTQDAITVIGIDTNARLVKFVRIGSNVTTRMIDRTMTAISY